MPIDNHDFKQARFVLWNHYLDNRTSQHVVKHETFGFDPPRGVPFVCFGVEYDPDVAEGMGNDMGGFTRRYGKVNVAGVIPIASEYTILELEDISDEACLLFRSTVIDGIQLGQVVKKKPENYMGLGTHVLLNTQIEFNYRHYKVSETQHSLPPSNLNSFKID